MMQPFTSCPSATLAGLRGVLADIDDTITTEGRLSAAAYGAMELLRDAGVMVVPITGRPAGWCDHIARMWPVEAVVGENGAFWFRYDHARRRMDRHYAATASERQAQRDRLRAIAEHILREVPGAGIAADQAYREADLAIDYCEDVAPLPEAAVARIAELMRAHGMTAKLSSIHVNGWFGDHDKLSMARDLLTRSFGMPEAALRGAFAYIGDSPNDEPMFGYFSCSVGVANVRDFVTRMQVLPVYVTEARAGAGFAEFARALVAARTTA